MKNPKTKKISPDLSDSQLVISLRRKRLSVEQEIVRRYQKKLFSYLYRLTGNREEAEDILQTVFFKVFRNIESFDARKKFSSWIYRIAHNEAVNFIKRQSGKRFVSWDEMLTDRIKAEIKTAEKDPLEQCIGKEKRKKVRAALQKLPEKYRQVLEMRYFQEKSYEEIGKILKKSVNTVGTLINRAKKKLQTVAGDDLIK